MAEQNISLSRDQALDAERKLAHVSDEFAELVRKVKQLTVDLNRVYHGTRAAEEFQNEFAEVLRSLEPIPKQIMIQAGLVNQAADVSSRL